MPRSGGHGRRSGQPLVQMARQVDQVFGVLVVVGCEGFEGGGVALAVAVPEADGFEAVDFGQLGGALDADFALDVLEAAGQAEAAGGVAEIVVGLIELEGGEGLAQEGHVEDRAEEADQQLAAGEGLLQGRGVEVAAADEGVEVAAVVDADHGDAVAARVQAGGLDVEVADLAVEGGVEAPVLGAFETAGEEPVIAALQGFVPAGDLGAEPAVQPGAHRGAALQGQVVAPVGQPGAPDGLLGLGPHTSKYAETPAYHAIHHASRRSPRAPASQFTRDRRDDKR